MMRPCLALRSTIAATYFLLWCGSLPGHAEEVASLRATEVAETPSPVIARWKGGSVDQSTLDSWFRYHRLADLSEPERHAQVRSMVFTLALSEAAERRGVDSEIGTRFTLENGDAQTLIKLLRGHLKEQVEVADAEISEQVRAQPELRLKPRKVRLRNILKRLPEAASEADRAEALARMAQIRTELVGGADFAVVAQRESDSQTRFRGGLIGNIVPSDLPPDVAKIAGSLEAGMLSPVLEIADGLMILKCDQIIAEKRRSPEEVREIVRDHLFRLAERNAWKAFQDSLLAQAQPRPNLTTARDPEADAEAPVVQSKVGTLTRGTLVRLWAAQPGRRVMEDQNDEVLHNVIEGWVLRQASARHARQLGLEKSLAFQDAADWKRRTHLLGEELAYQVRMEFKPLEPDEIKAYFESHREQFRHPDRYKVATIMVPLTEGEERARYRFAEAVRKDLDEGSISFEDASRTHSKHSSAPDGGVLDWLSARALAGFGPRPFQVIQSMKPGDLSPVVRQDGAVYLFRLDGHRAAKAKSWDEAAKEAERALGNERIAAVQARIETRLMAELNIQVESVP